MCGMNGLILLVFALLVENTRRWPLFGLQTIQPTLIEIIRLLGIFGLCIVLVASARRLLTVGNSGLAQSDAQTGLPPSQSAAPQVPQATGEAGASTPSDMLRGSKFFDADWYLARYPDVATAGADPAEHYLEAGAAEGRNPSPLFNSIWYLESNPDVAAQGVNPLIHYIQDGLQEGRAIAPEPLPRSDGTAQPTAAATTVGRMSAPPLSWDASMPELLRGSGFFDAQWYLAQNLDVAVAGVDPVEHYLSGGAAEGRNPSRSFDTLWYLDNNPDVAALGINPLIHYVQDGMREGREPRP